MIGHLKLFCVFALLPFSMCTTQNEFEGFDPKGTIDSEGKILAFVGRKIAVREGKYKEPEWVVSIDPETNEVVDEVLVSSDSKYEARYEILEVIDGSYNGSTIDFIAYDHYGIPNFTKHNVAMLYVTEYDGELVHKKYTYDTVHPTRDGRWAFCGNYKTEDLPEGITPAASQKIEFTPSVKEKISNYSDPDEYDQEEVAGWLKEPYFEITGDVAICKMGVYAAEIFRLNNEERFLPERRQQICKSTLNLDGKWKPENANKIRQCADDLKAQNLP